jgi:hypothetical protein
MRRYVLITACFLTALALSTGGAEGLVGTSASGRTLWLPFDGTHHASRYSVTIPSLVREGQKAHFAASTSASRVVVPKANYVWSFGDGTTASGPNIEHSFAAVGSDGVNLTLTDAGGCNSRTLTQTVRVLGSSRGGAGSSGSHAGSTSRLSVRLQLLPQSLRSVLGSGMDVRVSSNEAADGVTTICVSNAAARRARLGLGDDPHGLVVVGRGTVTGIKKGRAMLHIRIAKGTASKLAHLGHLTLTLRMTLFARNGYQTAVSVTGQY